LGVYEHMYPKCWFLYLQNNRKTKTFWIYVRKFWGNVVVFSWIWHRFYWQYWDWRKRAVCGSVRYNYRCAYIIKWILLNNLFFLDCPKMKVASFSETSVTNYQQTLCNIPEYSNLHQRRSENLNSHETAEVTIWHLRKTFVGLTLHV
jgi:hypothetical protein